MSPAILMFTLIWSQMVWLFWKHSAHFCSQRSKEILSNLDAETPDNTTEMREWSVSQIAEVVNMKVHV